MVWHRVEKTGIGLVLGELVGVASERVDVCMSVVWFVGGGAKEFWVWTLSPGCSMWSSRTWFMESTSG